MPDATKYDYVIIGNSAGGVGAVEAIRERDGKGSIAVISEETGPAYCRALISYLITGRVDSGTILYRESEFYRQKEVELISGVMAESVDYELRTVSLSGGREVGYSKLLLATGGIPFVPHMDGLDLKKVKNVFSFTTMTDALAVQELVNGGAKKAVVLGSGLLGLLAAEALRNRGLDVTVVELMDRVLGLVLDDAASKMIQDAFERAGVRFRLNNTITRVEGGKSINRVHLKDGDALECDLMVVAVGVRPRTELAEGGKVRVDRGIVVDIGMETSVPGVYACGDCVNSWDFVAEDFRNLPLWPVAYVGGRVAGHNMAGDGEEFTWGTVMNAFDFYDTCAISAGVLNHPEDDDSYREVSTSDRDSGKYRKLVFRDSRLVGFCFVNSVDRAGLYLHLMRQKVDVAGQEDALLDENYDLIDLPDEVQDEMLSQETRACRI